MRAPVLALLVAAAPAHALPDSSSEWDDYASGWEDAPYWNPQTRLRVVDLDGTRIPQLSAGTQVGWLYRQADAPHWYGTTRFAMAAQYGLSAASLGFDTRVGTRFGLDGAAIRITLGADVFFDFYGQPSSTDYYLPAGSGVNGDARLYLKLHPVFWLLAEAQPAWVLREERRGHGIGPTDETKLLAGGVIRTSFAEVSFGWVEEWTVVGHLRGIFVGGAL